MFLKLLLLDGMEKKFLKKRPMQSIQEFLLVNDILREATQRGTGKAIKKLERNDFAGKTGTTNDSESAWFTGFNNKILTTVWFGYDQPRSLGRNEYGSTTALPIWLNLWRK